MEWNEIDKIIDEVLDEFEEEFPEKDLTVIRYFAVSVKHKIADAVIKANNEAIQKLLKEMEEE